MFRDLEALLEITTEYYTTINECWLNKFSPSVNLKKKRVSDICADSTILNIIYQYCQFLNRESIKFLEVESSLVLDHSDITARVKTFNSILSKIDRYNEKKKKGGFQLSNASMICLALELSLTQNFHIEILKIF